MLRAWSRTVTRRRQVFDVQDVLPQHVSLITLPTTTLPQHIIISPSRLLPPLRHRPTSPAIGCPGLASPLCKHSSSTIGYRTFATSQEDKPQQQQGEGTQGPSSSSSSSETSSTPTSTTTSDSQPKQHYDAEEFGSYYHEPIQAEVVSDGTVPPEDARHISEEPDPSKHSDKHFFEEEKKLYEESLKAYNEQLVENYGKNFQRAVDVMRFARSPTNSLMIKKLQVGALLSMQSFAKKRAAKVSPTRRFSGIAQTIESQHKETARAGMLDSIAYEKTPNLYDKFTSYYLKTPWQYRIGKRLLAMEKTDPLRLRMIEVLNARVLQRIGTYWTLTKPRVTLMVVFTSWWGYALMVPFGALAWSNVGVLCLGTYFAAAAASIINQMREIDVDSKMPRTSRRPLVAGTVTLKAAGITAAAFSLASAAVLSQFGPIVPALALFNIFLYGGIYTSLKRMSKLNTEIGAIVGAIPPMMGYFAALPPGAPWHFDYVALLWPAMIMFAWQMQHVMLICRMRGQEYNRSGLVMNCLDDPGYRSTIAKGIAWAWLCIPIVAAPMFVEWSELGHIVPAMGWVLYALFYTKIMHTTPYTTTPGVSLLLWGYALVFATVVLSLVTQKTGRYDYVQFDLDDSPTHPLIKDRPLTWRELREIVAVRIRADEDRRDQLRIAAQRAVVEANKANNSHENM